MRKTLVALLAVALVLFGAVLPLVLPRSCPVTRAAFERIEAGMTQKEVHAILGGPPGDYRTGPPVDTRIRFVRIWHWGRWFPFEKWEGDEGTAFVEYLPFHEGPDEIVTRVVFEEAERRPSPVEVACWRLRKAWERLFP